MPLRAFLLLLLPVSLIAAEPLPRLVVDTSASLALRNGPHVVKDVDRDRYFRLYHLPGMFPDEIVRQMNELRVSPGRGTGPYFGDRGEDPGRFGRSKDVEGKIAEYSSLYARAGLQHPGALHALGGGSYPKFQPQAEADESVSKADATMRVKYNRVVPKQDFDAVADLLADWFTGLEAAGVAIPRFYTPLNEPDASWKTKDAPAEFADFSRHLALRLRETNPEVLISGPCTAWPYPGPNWERWKNPGWERAFIERAGDLAGGYDFHFYTKELWAYDERTPAYRPERRQPTPNLFASLANGHPEILDFGKADALMDIANSVHLAKWGKPVPPFLISEFGRQGITPQLGPWANSHLSYLFSTTITRLWMGFMNRPEIALTVPFILPESDLGYAPKRGQAINNRPGMPEDPAVAKTPLWNFIKFFRGFEGERVPLDWQGLAPADKVSTFAIAARQGDAVRILLHNASPAEFAFQLSLDPASASAPQATSASMLWNGAWPGHTEPDSPQTGSWRIDADPAPIALSRPVVLAPEETRLITLRGIQDPTRRWTQSRHYSTQNLLTLAAGATADFTVRLAREDLAHLAKAGATVCFAAPEAPPSGARLTLLVNGQPAGDPIPLDFLQGWRNIALPLTFAVDPGTLVEGDNRITARLDDAGDCNALATSARLDTHRLDQW